jgi:hypothetical protein
MRQSAASSAPPSEPSFHDKRTSFPREEPRRDALAGRASADERRCARRGETSRHVESFSSGSSWVGSEASLFFSTAPAPASLSLATSPSRRAASAAAAFSAFFFFLFRRFFFCVLVSFCEPFGTPACGAGLFVSAIARAARAARARAPVGYRRRRRKRGFEKPRRRRRRRRSNLPRLAAENVLSALGI